MRCKTVGCHEVVEYKPQPVNGLHSKPYDAPTGRLTVYLTCSGGHTHPYVVHQLPAGVGQIGSEV